MGGERRCRCKATALHPSVLFRPEFCPVPHPHPSPPISMDIPSYQAGAMAVKAALLNCPAQGMTWALLASPSSLQADWPPLYLDRYINALRPDAQRGRGVALARAVRNLASHRLDAALSGHLQKGPGRWRAELSGLK